MQAKHAKLNEADEAQVQSKLSQENMQSKINEANKACKQTWNSYRKTHRKTQKHDDDADD